MCEMQVFSCYRGWKEVCKATRGFNNIETRTVIKFSFLQGKAPKEIHVFLKEILGENAPSYVTVKNWVAQFKRGDFLHLYCASSWTTQSSDHSADYQIHELILEEC